MEKIPQQFEQLELDGILSEKDKKKDSMEKLEDDALSVPADEQRAEEIPNNKAPLGKVKLGYSFVKSLEKNSLDSEKRKKDLETFRKINERKDLL